MYSRALKGLVSPTPILQMKVCKLAGGICSFMNQLCRDADGIQLHRESMSFEVKATANSSMACLLIE